LADVIELSVNYVCGLGRWTVDAKIIWLLDSCPDSRLLTPGRGRLEKSMACNDIECNVQMQEEKRRLR
jgi:hypothetical protein